MHKLKSHFSPYRLFQKGIERMLQRPLLTILLPIRNGGEFLSTKFNYLRNIAEEYSQIEVVISVNVSQDHTREWIMNNLNSIPNNFQVWFQQNELSGGEQLHFLSLKAASDWVMFTAIDDFLTFKSLKEVLKVIHNSIEDVGYAGSWNYSEDIHGSDDINIKLDGELDDRIGALIQNIRVSHGIFYSLYRTKILHEYISHFGFDFIGSDWLFNIFLLSQIKIYQTKNIHITFTIDGLSRQRNTFRLIDNAFVSRIFPYWKLSKNILALNYIIRKKTIKKKLNRFAISLLIANLNRHIKRMFFRK